MQARIGGMFLVILSGFLVVATGQVATSQPPGGKGGFGPPGGEERKIVKDFDKNNDGWLDKEERALAREAAKKGGGGGFGPKGFGPKGGNMGTPKPGPAVQPGEVKTFPDAPLYDPGVLRTVFLEFENKDWEAEMQDFHGTDVDVPATLIVDGKKYPNVGVHFRGMSSYMGVGAGFKRSLNVSLDLADSKQRLNGYKTLNLLNSHDDASMMNTVLYSHIARKYLPAPKANFVKVVINGESWGVYVNVQQFDKVFLNENYKTTKGTRWKVRGSPGGGGGLEYLGDDVAAYKRRYQMKSGESEDAWKALVNFCKVLNQTPTDKLEEALKPIADVNELLWFLALDVALINCDGYWIRASDYTIHLDEKGKFHFVPHDMNEAFRPAGGPGFGGGPGGPGGGFTMRLPPPGDVLPPPVQDMLQLTDDQKKQLATLQKEVDASLEKLLTTEQKKQLKEMRDRGPGGFGPPGGGPGGPGGFGPPGGGPGAAVRGAVDLDPLIGLDDSRKPLRSKVLAVPALKAKYLECVRTIAAESLDWKKLGPVVADYRKLIEKEVEADTRKLDSFEAFKRMTDDVPPGSTTAPAGGGGFRGPMGMNVRAFAEQRQKYLLNYQPAKKPLP
ncbi:MAG: spore coat protein CotH [Planctomycetaceae bacterium]|nr:spore coat protein CotH [Planctomycetaceae bacterium]